MLAISNLSRCEDTVLVASSDEQRPTKYSGEILDYSGRELRLKTALGKERTFPADRVVSIATTWSQDHLAGDKLFGKHDYPGALEKYRAALDRKNAGGEKREWAQRQIAAQMVWCYRALGQTEQAGDLFLVIAEREPATRFFDAIPLAWIAGEPSPALEAKAKAWLARENQPAAMLLGASHLFSTQHRTAALDRLKQLSTDRDERISWLAQAQFWRATAFNATAEQLSLWERAIEKIPKSLRGGPYFVIGSALATRNPERAALVLLRVPVLYGRDRQLSAAASLAATTCLEKANLPLEAAKLRQELTGNYTGTHDEQFLQGLRDRRLFSLAERYCSERLQDSSLSDARRVELVSELSRSLAEHAVQSLPAQRAPLWRRAREVVDDFARQNPRSPRLLLVRVQGALAALAQGELARQEAELTAASEAEMEQTRTAIRAAIVLLKQLNDEVAAELIRRGRTSKAENDQLTAAELVSLQSSLRYQLARAFRNQALSYPADSADRINALTQALEMLEPFAKSPPEDPLTWPSRLDEVLCYRQLRDLASAEKKLAQLAEQAPPPEILPRLLAEAVRLGLARGRIDEAIVVAERASAGAGPGLAELDYARLEAYLAAWQRAAQGKQSADASQWEKKSTDEVRRIEENHGPYWMRRAETLLARSIGRSPAAESSDALARAAASLYRSGQIDEALDAYDRAVAQARGKDDAGAAFDLALTAATIESQRKNYGEASARYRKLAVERPEHPKASESHLLAIYNAGQAAQQVQPPNLQAYGDLLVEHLSQWPKAATTGQAAWWLGVLREHARAWPDAVAAYRRVPIEHVQYIASVEGSARCYTEWLAELRATGKPDREVSGAAIQYFESLVLGPDKRLPERWSAAARVAVLAAARIELADPGAGARRAEELLTAALQNTDGATAEWTAAARTLLVSALAVQRRPAEAQKLLAQISGGSPGELIALLENLSRSNAGAAADLRKQVAALELQTVALLQPRRKELNASQQLTLDCVHAAALADSGRRKEALAAWEALAKNHPSDGRIQEELATLLLDSNDTAVLRLALAKWREVEQKSRPGSPRWLRANYALARAHFALGSRSQARAIIKLAELSYPELGGGDLKTKFLNLLAECER